MAAKPTPAAAPSGSGAEKQTVFTAGLVQDQADVLLGTGQWTHARNAINTTHRGDAGTLSNEASNLLLATVPYPVIGLLHHHDTSWVVMSTDDITSEIGLFDEQLRTYQTLTTSTELGFRTSHLIGGWVKAEYDTTYSAYWQDGLNPDRCLNLDRIPYRTTGRNLSPDPSCFIPEYTGQLDVDALLLHPHIQLPTLSLSKNVGGGQLPAGSYQAYLAYSAQGIRVTDYFTPSQPVGLWSHSGAGGAVKLSLLDAANLTTLDATFEEYELVLVSVLNGQTQARRVGYYSTRQTQVVLDQLDAHLPAVDLALLNLQHPIYHQSDGMHALNGYLIRTGVSTRPDFNYQPQANQIASNWVSVSYPADYYAQSGVNVGYLRDELYAYFIRWVYNTGLKSASYHLPGRAAAAGERTAVSGADVLAGDTERWQVEDTSTKTLVSGPEPTADGGQVTARGRMQFWESGELYPDRQPAIWGALCGHPIRHHKFPGNETSPHFGANGDTISVLGVEFTGITHPLDEHGLPIRDLVGYEILRGSREGNKSIIAKGLLSNLVEYTIPGTSSFKGLYDNYPYNDLRPDKFLLDRETVLFGSGDPDDEVSPVTAFQTTQFGFHSPDTTFNKPFLSGAYLQLCTEHTGTVLGSYAYAHDHPKEKLITNAAFVQAVIVGLGIATLAAIGPGQMSTELSAAPLGIGGTATWSRSGGTATAIPDAIANAIFSPATTIAGIGFMMAAGSYYAGMGINEALEMIYKMSTPRQYVLQYNSHGFYNQTAPLKARNRRRAIVPGQVRYVGSHVQDYSGTHRINNWGRQPLVALTTTAALLPPTGTDTTRQRVRDLTAWDHPLREFATNTSAYYAALKLPTRSQYGQLDGITQLLVHSGTCPSVPGTTSHTPVLFGGDVYINRYAEKNQYLYFNKWLGTGIPDDFEYDYRQGLNGPPPRYWANFEHFDYADIDLGIDFRWNQDNSDMDGGDRVDLGLASITYHTPTSMHSLDRESSVSGSIFSIKEAYFYLSNNGVRDFFVESEMNLAFRDYGEQPGERHYSPYDHYTDLATLFRSDLITQPELLKYDPSLSVGRLYYNFRTAASVLGRDFDPLTAATRFTYYPDRAIYSLQHQAGLKRDNWKTYLANNYKDFGGLRITQIKALNATGALVLFANGEPVQFTGVDTLQTGAGVKLTIGDGGLFQQGLQAVVNADDSLEYGSCQGQRASVNTPYGLFWMSQKTGKILQYTGSGQAQPISNAGLSRWFALHLPSRLLDQFPGYERGDNPVAGVGCAVAYDATYELLYFSKRDYAVRSEFLAQMSYGPTAGFLLRTADGQLTQVSLGDARYFEACSWTISYDPAGRNGKPAWVSFHDWVPGLSLPSYQHFLTVQGGGFYRHNARTDSFGTFYGIDQPFEVELVVSSTPAVGVVRSVEYLLECYRYSEQGQNAFLLLDENFDQALVYNNEQNSGLLALRPATKGNPVADLRYPHLNTSSDPVLEVLYGRVENTYRINQFWDQTKDRGEFSGAQVPMFTHQPNGFEHPLNPAYFDYTKKATEHKRFRHYLNRVLLRKTSAGATNLILKLTTTKLAASAR